MRYIGIIVAVLIFQRISAQNFVNGDFEINSARVDKINLSNADLNNMLPGVTAFGSYGDVDIISSSTYGGSGAQNKQWYIALTGGGTDIVALELTKPLIEGKKYTISFYDRRTSGYTATPIQLGLSDNNNQFGTAVYTCEQAPVLDKWTRKVCTFVAPHSGKYITVQMPEGGISNWVNIDNFTFVGSNAVENDTNLVTVKTVTSSAVEKDSIPLVNTNTVTVVKKEFVKFTKRKCKDRKYEVQQTMTVEYSEVLIHVYDKNKVDGDIVTIYLNGELVAENLTVNKDKKEIRLHLQSGSNILVMYAINLGNIPPNTAAIAVNNTGKKFKVSTLVSDFKISGALELIYAPEGLSMK